MAAQCLVALGHQRIRRDVHGLDRLGDKAVGRDDRLALAALREGHQRLRPRVVALGWQVKEQAPGQGIVFRGNQAVERQHGHGLAVGNRHGLGRAHVGQADEADAMGILSDGVGQLFAGFKPFCAAAQGFAMTTENQLFESIVGAGLIIARIEMNGSAFAA
ncbi:hypothetical protein D3C73_837450 [compost metagenome]